MGVSLARRTVLAALAAGMAARAGAARASTSFQGAAPLCIGALYPLSGPHAVLGDESFRGLELAVEERNAAGGLLGRPLQLVKADAADPAAAVAEARRLIEARVGLVFGTLSGPLSLAATQVTESAGLPYFELCALADAVTDRGLRLVFRSCPTAASLGAAAADAVLDTLAPLWGVPAGSLRVALLHRDGLDSINLADAQEARLRARSAPPAERLSYPRDATDLTAAIQRCRAGAVDAVLHAGLSGDVAPLFRQMRAVGWRPRMIVGAGAAYSLADTAEAVGPDMNGAMTVDVPQYASRDAPRAAAVAAAYQRRYGMRPRCGHSLANLCGAQVFMDAVQRAGSLEPERVRAAVLATDVATGGTSAGWGVGFDERGQNRLARSRLLQWQDGALVTIGPEDAAVAPPRSRLAA